MIFLKCILVAFLFCASPLAAEGEKYAARIFAGYNSISLSYHPGALLKVRPGQIFGGAVAYHFTSCISGEAELSYRWNEVRKLELKGKTNNYSVPLSGDIKSFSIFCNGVMDLPLSTANLKPYVGAGVGVTAEYGNWNANIIQDSVWFNYEAGSQTAPSYQIILGVRTAPADGYYFAVEFRALDAILDHMCNHNRSTVFNAHKLF